jgi:uncharacterized membrane protein
MMFVRGLGDFGRFCGGFGLVNPWGMAGIAAAVVVAVVILIVLAATKKRKGSSGSALEALKLRFVKGEITSEEYLKMKETLGK